MNIFTTFYSKRESLLYAPKHKSITDVFSQHFSGTILGNGRRIMGIGCSESGNVSPELL
jgi:hypothetical protein